MSLEHHIPGDTGKIPNEDDLVLDPETGDYQDPEAHVQREADLIELGYRDDELEGTLPEGFGDDNQDLFGGFREIMSTEE